MFSIISEFICFFCFKRPSFASWEQEPRLPQTPVGGESVLDTLQVTRDDSCVRNRCLDWYSKLLLLIHAIEHINRAWTASGEWASIAAHGNGLHGRPKDAYMRLPKRSGSHKQRMRRQRCAIRHAFANAIKQQLLILSVQYASWTWIKVRKGIEQCFALWYISRNGHSWVIRYIVLHTKITSKRRLKSIILVCKPYRAVTGCPSDVHSTSSLEDQRCV